MRSEELQKMYDLEDRYWWFVTRRHLVRDLVARFSAPDPRILDIGCGTGGTLDHLSGLGALTGTDVSDDALRLCRTRGHESLVRCAAENLGFADGTVDLAVLCDMLEHLDDDALGLSEVLRVLKPGGVAIITVPAHQWLWSEHDIALSHRRRYSRKELADRLEATGFQKVKLTYAVTFVFPIVCAFRLLRRLHLQGVGKPHTQLMSLPGWLNRALIWLHHLENWIVIRAGFPFGTTLLAIVRKPESS